MNRHRLQFSEMFRKTGRIQHSNILKYFLLSRDKTRPYKMTADRCLSSATGPGKMGSAATIVFARENLSIPGAPISARPSMDHADAVRKRFFALVSDSKPDVIVLDFS